MSSEPKLWCQSIMAKILVALLKCVYMASKREKTSFEVCGHNGESATTLPMTISVGDTNSADAISLARSFSSANTCMNAYATT